MDAEARKAAQQRQAQEQMRQGFESLAAAWTEASPQIAEAVNAIVFALLKANDTINAHIAARVGPGPDRPAVHEDRN